VVEKAVSTLGEAPQGLRDVFELCRGFEKAFSNIVNVSIGSCSAITYSMDMSGGDQQACCLAAMYKTCVQQIRGGASGSARVLPQHLSQT
jgi:hypothetical protein